MYEALTWGAEAARLLGLDLPDDREKAQQQLATEIGRIYQRISETPIESLIDLPAMENPRIIALVELLVRCGPAAYQVNRPLFGLNTCHMVSLSLTHGNCSTSAYVRGAVSNRDSKGTG